MSDAPESVRQVAVERNFSGAVRVDRDGKVLWQAAYGMADRRHGVANTVDTQFATASATKGLTAVTVVSLIRDGVLDLDTTARSLLGTDLPLINDAVTVQQLLGHRSGIGDYFDEDLETDIADFVLPISVHRLDAAEAYLQVLDGFEQKFAPDERFSYCNGGYVVLALPAERSTRVPYGELVQQRVCVPAGMRDTAFLRSDELPGRAAIGYLSGDADSRTNVFHLPVVGVGDGGVYSTLADVHAFWSALFDGRLLPGRWVEAMVRPRSEVPAESLRYGLGFWLHASSSAVMLVGMDAGVSFRSVHDPDSGITHTTVSNTSNGAWPVTFELDRLYSA